jgi:hypothetical protein
VVIYVNLDPEKVPLCVEADQNAVCCLVFQASTCVNDQATGTCNYDPILSNSFYTSLPPLPNTAALSPEKSMTPDQPNLAPDTDNPTEKVQPTMR